MAAPLLGTPYLLVPIAFGVGLSGFFSGANFALTYISVPALLLPASHLQAKNLQQSVATPRPAAPASQLARQWRFTYMKGRGALPPFGLVASMCFAYVAWGLSNTQPSNVKAEKSLHDLKWIFVAAASFALSIVPWTLIAMKSTNDALTESAGQADGMAKRDETDVLETEVKSNEKELEGMTTDELMRRWGFLNLIRSGLVFSAIVTVVVGLFLYA